MKKIILLNLVLFLFQSKIARATNDYQETLSRLQKNDSKIEQRIRAMGFLARPEDPTNPLNAESKKGPLLFKVHDLLSSLRVVTGKLLGGVTFTRLVVGPEGSPAIIDLSENQGLFSGLRALGQAKQSSVEGRLFIDCDRVVLRNGKVIPVKATVLDIDGAYGLKAQVFSSKALMIAGSMAGSFLSGFAVSQQTQVQSPFGFTQTPPSGRNAILQGVGQTAADQSKRLIDEATKEKPVLVVETLTPIQLYLDEEVRF